MFNRNRNPHWARSLSSADYEEFKRLLLEQSDGALNIDKTGEDGMLRQDDRILGIANFTAKLANTAKNAWPAEISNWLRLLSQGEDLSGLAYPRALSKLSLQLYPDGFFRHETDAANKYLFKQLIPSTLATVVVKESDAVYTLNATKNPSLKEHKEEVFDQLLASLKTQTPMPIKFLENDEDVIALIESPDIMTAAQALVFEDIYPQLVGRGGSLISIPNRHTILVQMLQDNIRHNLSAMFAALTGRLYLENRYPISPNLYHYQNATFKQIRINK
ncbi:MAG TPA: hypothetical protein VI322_04765 [Candidatus Saccharimonadia bacterium]